MPILVGTGLIEDPPVDPPVPPVDEDEDPYTPPAGADLPELAWIDPFGTVWALSDLGAGWFTAEGVTGLGAAPVTITADEQPRQGTRIRHIQPRARTLTWPLYVEGSSHIEFLDRWRRLARAFTSTRVHGPGQLVITRPDGSARVMEAYYEAGWDGTPGAGVTWDILALSLYCPQPFWRARDQVQALHADYGEPTSYLDPFPNVSTGSTLGRTNISNSGDVESWPVWTITGPADIITITNHTTGEAFTLDAGAFRSALIAGETVVITTDPGTVTGPAISGDTGWAQALDWPTASLFSLAEGDNDIEFEVTGSDAGTSIRCAFYPRYETA